MTPEQLQTYNNYYRQHQRCPSCKSDDLEVTTLGCLVGRIPEAIDINRATCCNCGWRGTVNDLVPDPKVSNQEPTDAT